VIPRLTKIISDTVANDDNTVLPRLTKIIRDTVANEDNTVIPRLTKIIRSGITFVSRNVISRRFLQKIVQFVLDAAHYLKISFIK